MSKKEWLNPEVLNLGVESTKEDGLGDDAQVLTWYKCEYCEQRFWTKAERNKHQNTCPSKPQPPAGEGEGDDPVIMPTLS